MTSASAEAVQPPSRALRRAYVGDGSYAFSYEVNAPEYGTFIQRAEEADGKITRGHWKVALPDRRLQTVRYHADDDGFLAEVSYDSDHASSDTFPPAPPSLYLPPEPVVSKPRYPENRPSVPVVPLLPVAPVPHYGKILNFGTGNGKVARPVFLPDSLANTYFSRTPAPAPVPVPAPSPTPVPLVAKPLFHHTTPSSSHSSSSSSSSFSSSSSSFSPYALTPTPAPTPQPVNSVKSLSAIESTVDLHVPNSLRDSSLFINVAQMTPDQKTDFMEHVVSSYNVDFSRDNSIAFSSGLEVPDPPRHLARGDSSEAFNREEVLDRLQAVAHP
ncbi:uncharacterized protein LOC143026193 [Oratosquilla oratoria]|uniref:uncharacterized protein LOC143026193 n=1 Tax=Oratosquilla oratoria TaxID=337810 RepID=UPI003F76706B